MGDQYALPYIQPVCTGVKNVPVYTGHKYGTYIWEYLQVVHIGLK